MLKLQKFRYHTYGTLPLFHLSCQLSALFVCYFSLQLHLFAPSAFSSVCLQLQLSASFVGSSAFASLIFICLFLLDINDVYSLDIFLLKIRKSTRFISIFPHYRLNFRAAFQHYQAPSPSTTSGSSMLIPTPSEPVTPSGSRHPLSAVPVVYNLIVEGAAFWSR